MFILVTQIYLLSYRNNACKDTGERKTNVPYMLGDLPFFNLPEFTLLYTFSYHLQTSLEAKGFPAVK